MTKKHNLQNLYQKERPDKPLSETQEKETTEKENQTRPSFIGRPRHIKAKNRDTMCDIPPSDGAISAPQTNIVTFQYPAAGLVENVRLVESSSLLDPPKEQQQQGKEKEEQQQQQQQEGNNILKPLDFIGPSAAVKDIFGLPYSSDVGVAIAVHNLGNGTLLIDGAAVQDEASDNMNDFGTKVPMPFVMKRKRPRPRGQTIGKNDGVVSLVDKPTLNTISSSSCSSFSSPPFQTLDREVETYQDTLLKHISEMMKMQTKYLSMVPQEASHDVEISTFVGQESGCIGNVLNQQENNNNNGIGKDNHKGMEMDKDTEPHETLGQLLPAPEDYAEHVLSSPGSNHHRFYQPWKFDKYNLLVGSDVLVVKPLVREEPLMATTTTMKTTTTKTTTTTTTTTTAENTLDRNGTLTIRIVDCEKLQSKWTQPSTSVQSKSYAQVLCRGNDEPSRDMTTQNNDNAIVSYPDFARLSLQSCVLPSPDNFQHQLHQHGFSARPVGVSDVAKNDAAGRMSSIASSSSSSPICMVLDAYLDNVIANVPQLALCLQERGLVQAVKLFETKELPNLSSKDLLSHNFTENEVLLSGKFPSKPLFSQSVVESNAALMFDFLKTNCCRENSTYLLTRNAGETKVQLLDVTSLSRQRQRKWIYWLAMISMRFAMRLGNLGKEHECDESLKREYRQKKRGLLENALELLHELADMGGGNHETICASIYEQLADSFLSSTASSDESTKGRSQDSSECSFLLSGQMGVENMVYNCISIDSLSKASDLLKAGIKTIIPPLETAFEKGNPNHTGVSVELEALSLQIYGLHHKLINVSLSLANKYLLKYRSSSVMQSLRLSARSISDAASLFLRIVNMTKKAEEFLGNESTDFILSLAFQYSLLMENCGNFARSFAADSSWRERGHACGEDIIALLRDVELLSHPTTKVLRDNSFSSKREELFCITSKSKGVINLDYVSGLVPLSEEGDVDINAAKSIDMANEYLENQKQLKKDKRRVLVAACLTYGQAADIFSRICCTMYTSKSRIWPILLQRLGDAHNEIGKVLLDDLHIIIRKDPRSKLINPFLLSAEWWFKEGLEIFELCSDVRNIALLHCNLSQCCKIRSSASSSRMNFRRRYDCLDRNLDSHAEICLNDAARHLELAHEALDQRDTHDSKAWDMVSLELASIYLLLGVRRRQLLIGEGSSLLSESLSPGAERSIVTPIKRAKEIYLSLGIDHKVAAADYQLALYYARIWTCQRDEALTKEKLSKAFSYFGQAHKYFFTHTESNEDTLVCLLLDLCSLYSTTSTSYECQEKALLCCLDACRPFSTESVNYARNRASSADWFTKMDSLNDKMEERVLGLLSSLVKMEKHDRHLPPRYEAIYRRALEIKLGSNSERMLQSGAYRVFEILNVIKTNLLKQKS